MAEVLFPDHVVPLHVGEWVDWLNSGALTLLIRHHLLIPLLIRYTDNPLKITGTRLVAMLLYGYFLNIAHPGPEIM